MERPNEENAQQICHEHNIYGQNSFLDNANALFLAYKRGKKDVLKSLNMKTYEIKFSNLNTDTITLTAEDLHDDTIKDKL